MTISFCQGAEASARDEKSMENARRKSEVDDSNLTAVDEVGDEKSGVTN